MSDDYYANCWKQFHFKIQWSEQKDNIYFSFLHLKKKYQNFLIPKLRNKILNIDTRIVAWIAYIHEFVLFFWNLSYANDDILKKKMFLHLTFPYQNKFQGKKKKVCKWKVKIMQMSTTTTFRDRSICCMQSKSITDKQYLLKKQKKNI